MDKPLIVVLGDKGFLGRSLVQNFLARNFSVLGIRRNQMCFYDGQFSYEKEFDLEKFHEIVVSFSEDYIFLNCVRDGRFEFSEDILLRMLQLSQRASLVINFSTYIQHYESAFTSTMKLYRDNQLRKSAFLSKNLDHKKLVDLSLFTLYGVGDSPMSFLHAVTKDMIQNKEIQLTGLNQLISYTLVDDVCKLINSLVEETLLKYGNYSFWQAPPERLEKYFFRLMKLTLSTSNFTIGARDYKGHEIFEYREEIFPPQISPTFSWTNFEDGIRFLLSKY
jgi:hypothetical protein